jgi:hypothetical protein
MSEKMSIWKSIKYFMGSKPDEKELKNHIGNYITLIWYWYITMAILILLHDEVKGYLLLITLTLIVHLVSIFAYNIKRDG